MQGNANWVDKEGDCHCCPKFENMFHIPPIDKQMPGDTLRHHLIYARQYIYRSLFCHITTLFLQAIAVLSTTIYWAYESLATRTSFAIFRLRQCHKHFGF